MAQISKTEHGDSAPTRAEIADAMGLPESDAKVGQAWAGAQVKYAASHGSEQAQPFGGISAYNGGVAPATAGTPSQPSNTEYHGPESEKTLGEYVHDVVTSGHRDVTQLKVGSHDIVKSTDYLPAASGDLKDVTVVLGTQDTQHGFFGDATTRFGTYLGNGKILGWVQTTVEPVDKDHDKETVTGTHENVPGSINLNVGDSRIVPHATDTTTTSVAWAPQEQDNSSDTTSPDKGASEVTPASGSDESNPYANCPGVINYRNSGPDHSFVEIGTSRSCTDTNTVVTVENDQGELRAFGSADEFNEGSSGAANGPGSSVGGTAAITGSGAGSVTGGDDDKTDDGHKSDDSNNNDGHHDGDGDDNHDDTKDDTKEEAPTTDAKGDMPNPEGGPGSPNSTPDPDGDGTDGEGSHHGPTVNQGSSVGHLSTQLAAVGNSQDGASTDGYHGPRDPGEEMPDPDSNGGGNPVSNVAHGAGSFWDQAATATQGVTQGPAGATQTATSGLQLSASAVSEHTSASQLGSGAVTTSHDIAGAFADTSAHAAVSAHDVSATGAALHGELGTATLHDTLALSSGSFATQMHV